jgi:hypothetical protein
MKKRMQQSRGLRKRVFLRPTKLPTRTIPLTQNQQRIFDFLNQTKRTSKEVALRTALKPQNTLDRVVESVRLLEEVRLNPKVYGVERIPAKYWENALIYSPSKIRVWLIESIKNQLMNDFATKTLNRVWPEWRNTKISHRLHPATLLSKWRELTTHGLKPTEENLGEIPIDTKGYATKKGKSKKDLNQARARIKALKEAGVPLTGVVRKLALPQEKFDALINRYKAGRKFNGNQEKIYTYLISKGVQEEIAYGIASRKNTSLRSVIRKFTYMESIILDPAYYGLEKIPLRRYEEFLGLSFPIFQMRIRKRVINRIEDQHAAKILDTEFPEWRTKKKLARHRPVSILAKVRVIKELGLIPSAWLVTTKSLEELYGDEPILTRKQPKKKIKSQSAQKKRISKLGGPRLNFKEKVNEFIGENNIPMPVFQKMLDSYTEMFGDTRQTSIDYVTQKLIDRVNARAHIVPYEKLFRFASRAMYGYWKKD